MSRRGSRFPRDNGRCGDPNNMARTMEIFKIPFPPVLNPPAIATAAQSGDKQGLSSPDPVVAEQSCSKRGRSTSDSIPPAQSKRGLIRIVTDQEMEKSQVSGAPLSSDQASSSSLGEETSRSVNADTKMCGSNVHTTENLSVAPSADVHVPATLVPPTFVTPVNSKRVGSLKELLQPLLSVNSQIVAMTVIMKMSDGETMVINGDI